MNPIQRALANADKISAANLELERLSRPRCPWCADPNSQDESGENLCRPHAAEFEGLSENELDRMESEQRADASGE